MKLSEIIDRVNLYVPSPYTDDEKTEFINSAIEGIKRFAGINDVYSFKASGLKIYPLPDGVAGECVLAVWVGGGQLPCADITTDTESFFYILPTGFIGFSDTPRVGDRIEIVYTALSGAKRRTEFDSDADFLAQEIYIDTEYLPLLANFAAADIAAAMEDISLSNNLRSEYNRLYLAGLQGKYQKRGRYPVTKMVKR